MLSLSPWSPSTVQDFLGTFHIPPQMQLHFSDCFLPIVYTLCKALRLLQTAKIFGEK